MLKVMTKVEKKKKIIEVMLKIAETSLRMLGKDLFKQLTERKVKNRQRKGHRPFTWSVPFALLASNKHYTLSRKKVTIWRRRK